MSLNNDHYPFISIWHGNVIAHGLFLPFSEYHQDHMYEKILAHYQPNTQLYENEYGCLLISKDPLSMNMDDLQAWPLVKLQNIFTSVPLTVEHQKELSGYDVVVVWQGQLLSWYFSDLNRVDLSRWVNLDHWQVLSIDISMIPPAVMMNIPKDFVKSSAVILNVGDAPETLSEIDQVKIKRKRTKFKPQNILKSSLRNTMIFVYCVPLVLVLLTASKTSWISILSIFCGIMIFLGLMWMIGLVLGKLFKFTLGLWRTDSNQSVIEQDSDYYQQHDRINGSRSALSSWWRKFKSLFKQGSSSESSNDDRLEPKKMNRLMNKYLNRQQQKYMDKMLKLFDQEDYDNALRYAIPFNKSEGNGNIPLKAPSPRDGIRISINRSRYSGEYQLSHDFDMYLRQIYRQAFERLDRAGNVDHAAYVLADLLDELKEAADYLVKHDRIELAAELVTAKGENVGLAIRLWLKLGQKDRAFELAERTNSYNIAINVVEQYQEYELSNLLRIEYARKLYDHAAYGLAFEQIEFLHNGEHCWPLVQAIGTAGLQLDNMEGVQIIAKMACLQPEREEELIAYYQDHLSGKGRRVAKFRLEFLTKIEKFSQKGQKVLPDFTHRLTKQILRLTLVDLMMHDDLSISKKGLGRYFNMLNQDAIQYDRINVSKFSKVKSQKNNQTQTTTIIDVNVLPGLPMNDVVITKHGDYLLALGDVGAYLVKIDDISHTITRRFNCHADQLIISTLGLRAIALEKYRSDHIYKVYVLELDTGKSRLYGIIKAEVFASTYDGAVWLVYDGESVYQYDMQKIQPTIVWSVSNLGDRQLEYIRRDSEEFSLVFSISERSTLKIEWWNYVQNGERLESRQDYQTSLRDQYDFQIHYQYRYHLIWQSHQQPSEILIEPCYSHHQDLEPYTVSEVDSDELWCYVGNGAVLEIAKYSDHIGVNVVQTDWRYIAEKKPFKVNFQNAQKCFAQMNCIDEHKILLWDEAGRLVIIDLNNEIDPVQQLSV